MAFLKNTKSRISELQEITPPFLKRVIKSRFIISVLALTIGGIIGGRSDDFFINKFLPWFVQRSEYPNVLFPIFIILIILLLWMVICSIRLIDDRNKYKEINIQSEKRNSELFTQNSILEKENAILNERISSHRDSVVSWGTSDEFYSELTKIVTTSAVKQDLLISIGEGESLTDWVLRIIGEAHSGRGNLPKIRTIIIKRLSDAFCDVLMRDGVLHPDFKSRMLTNLKYLQQSRHLALYGINVEITCWDRLPRFHGFIYDKRFIINNWRVDPNGYLHVRTNLIDYHADAQPDLFEEIIESFYNHGG